MSCGNGLCKGCRIDKWVWAFYRDSITLWPNFGNDMKNICVGPILAIIQKYLFGLNIGNICGTQNNLWGLYVSGQMKLGHVACGKKLYLNENKIVYLKI